MSTSQRMKSGERIRPPCQISPITMTMARIRARPSRPETTSLRYSNSPSRTGLGEVFVSGVWEPDIGGLLRGSGSAGRGRGALLPLAGFEDAGRQEQAEDRQRERE